MAHVVGVPKRDPCRKCQLPVFLAERLMVGKNVYHRTCLKCARCGYQLTPGSFYETETDEQYCCETCPDEEVCQNSTEQQPLSSDISATNVELNNATKPGPEVLESPVMSVRNSIKERLAFFENQRSDPNPDTKLLQKSLSDEEKSKSLQRVEAVETSYKHNPALSNFLNNTVDSEEEISEPSFSLQNSTMETSDSEADTDDLTNVSLPPELPKSLPPSKEEIPEKLEERKRFSVSTQLVLSHSPNITFGNVDEQQNTIKSPINANLTTELNIKFSSTDNSNNNNSEQSCDLALTAEHQTEKETVKFYPKKLDDNLELSERNDNYCVTKDKSADEIATNTAAEETQHILDKREESNAGIELAIPSDELQKIVDDELIEENIAKLRTNKNEDNACTNTSVNSQLENNATTDRLIVANDSLQQFEDITNNQKAITPKIPVKYVAESEIVANEDNITPIFKKDETFDMENNDNTKSPLNHIKNETKSEAETEQETENISTTPVDGIVPLKMKTKDNEQLDNDLSTQKEQLEGNSSKENLNNIKTPQNYNSRASIKEYPNDLNPFESDEEHEEDVDENNKENIEQKNFITKSSQQANLNPFDSSDDDVELEKAQKSLATTNLTPKVPPPRPPPPRISKNPFGSEDEDEKSVTNFTRRSSLTGSQRKTPVPTPRSNISQSQNPTPEPTPRLSTNVNTTTSYSASTTPSNSSLPILQNSSEFYGSANSLYSNNAAHNLLRNSDVRSSNNSLNLSAGGTVRSRKSRRAPLPPAAVKELFPSNETINSSSKTSTPSSSTVGTPKSARKKRPAPAPPKPARLEASQVPEIHVDTVSTQPKNLNNYPLQSELDSKLSDEEKALLEGKTLKSLHSVETDLSVSPSSRRSSKRLILLDKELLEEHGSQQYAKESNSQCDDLKQQNQQKSPTVTEEEPNVVYRRVLIPPNLETPTHEHNPLMKDLISKSPSPRERQMEKLKDNKEANNRNRQSQISVSSTVADDTDPIFNKSAHGKWKRRKGPAPALPLPPRKVLQMLPLQEIKHELEIIEVQQQGLEKQGVILEKMIRDRCEGQNGEPLDANGLPAESKDFASGPSISENTKEVENLILQLFELVNEKNELFRRQAELMYLRRQHRLEQEQADLEYEIRILMAQPERNKTDSDKAREEALIERLVEVVQLRNEVVECLEMDRIREAEEDQSIKQRLESHIAKRDDDSYARKTLTKLSKKEKKKQKEAKKLFKSKKLDADKDADESELNVDKQKSKKKKKLLIF